jgi:hypothetical protein
VTEPAVQAAIELLARRFIAQKINDWADLFADRGEDFPDVGEWDWRRIENAVAGIAANLDQASSAEFDAAYRLLADRA